MRSPAAWTSPAAACGRPAGPLVQGRARLLSGFVAAAFMILLALAPAASAQPVLVRSGEHADFSRLAMVLVPPRPWTLAQDGDAHVLRIPGAGGFDLSRVFALIPRDRLRDLAVLPGGQGLRMELACDCPLRAFEDRPGVLVIDILDAPSPLLPALAGIRPAPRPGVLSAEARPPPRPKATAPAGGALGAWLGAGFGPVPLLPVHPAEATPEAAEDPRLAGAREQLATQVARAASQNMLSMNIPPTVAPQRPSHAVAGPFDATQGTSAGLGLSVLSAVDRDARSRRTGSGIACIAGDRLDIGSWGDPGAGWATVMQRRAALLGEFDTPRPGAVQALVRGYLHLGLGAEAGAVLRAFPGQAEDEQLLALLAWLADGGSAPDSGLAGMAECGGPAALWALLARNDLPPRAELDRAGLVLGFAALPAHLRRLFGPRLSERFLDAGEAATAMTLRDAILRTPEGGGPATALLDARLALESGMPEVARGLLAPLANSGRAEAPEASILLVEAMLAGGRPVPDALRDTLAALAFEHRGTGLGIRLEAALAEADAASGRIVAAFARRDRIARELPQAAAAALDMRLLTLLVERAPDDAFLRHALPADGWRGGGTAAGLRQALARRFLDLGLPDAAIAALASGARTPEAERLLRAEALLGLGDSAAALPQLGGIAGPVAARLRGAAFEALGDPAAASAALAAAGLEAEAAAMAWRSGVPALIARYGTATQVTAAGVASGLGGAAAPAPGPAPLPEPAGASLSGDPGAASGGLVPQQPAAGAEALSLARARALLSAGEGLRADIEALFRAHPEP